jgi:hypothetical protein
MPEFGKCPVEGCQEPLPHQHLACVRHWRMVPVALRREVTAAFKAYRGVMRRPVRSAREIHEVADKLRAAQARAIAAVNEKETKRAIAAAAAGDVLDFG